MQVTIIYATYSNSTALATEFVQEWLKKAGHEVQRVLVAEATAEMFQSPDLLILASPSWDYNGQQGMPHEDFEPVQARLGDLRLDGKPTAVLGLGDTNFTHFCGATEHLTEWLQARGATAVVAPLKIDQYYVNEAAAKEQILAWIKSIVVLVGVNAPQAI